jgi:hypothetical protein
VDILGCARPYAGRKATDWITLLNRVTEIGLLTARGGGYYEIHPAAPWFLKQGFETAFGPAADVPPPLRAWVEAMAVLAIIWANRLNSGKHRSLAVLQALKANLLRARAVARRHGWWQDAIRVMHGLYPCYVGSRRWAAWTELVSDIVPLVEDGTTGQPRPDRDHEWSLVAEFRIGLARQRHDSVNELLLLERLVIVNRDQAMGSLSSDPATLDHDQRNRIRSLAAALQQLGTAQIEADDSACIRSLGEAQTLLERLGLPYEAAIVAYNIGSAHLNVTGLRDFDRAEIAARKSLSLCPEANPTSRAICHGLLGNIAWYRFRTARQAETDIATQRHYLDAAVASYRIQLQLAPENAHDDRAVAHNQLGLINKTIGSFDDSAIHYCQSIHHREASGNTYEAATTRYNLANLYRAARRFQDARDFAQAALASFDSFGGRAAGDVQRSKDLIARIEREDNSL